MVLRCRTQHRRSADIDILDGFLVGYVRFCDRFRERIQIHNNQIDVVQTKLLHLTRVLLVITNRKQSAVYSRVQGFDTSVHDFWESCHIGNPDDWNTFFSQKRACSTCRDDFYA
ncbi:hypothetical protein D3C71_1380240 [compost metagenome]